MAIRTKTLPAVGLPPAARRVPPAVRDFQVGRRVEPNLGDVLPADLPAAPASRRLPRSARRPLGRGSLALAQVETVSHAASVGPGRPTRHDDAVARQSSERKRAALVQRTEASLRADLERYRAETADCWSSDCVCHQDAWQEISTIRFLLGEDPTV